MPDVPRLAMYSGLVADRIQRQSQRSGLLTTTLGLIGRGETVTPTKAAAIRSDAARPWISIFSEGRAATNHHSSSGTRSLRKGIRSIMPRSRRSAMRRATEFSAGSASCGATGGFP